jgi:hypothetical protein
MPRKKKGVEGAIEKFLESGARSVSAGYGHLPNLPLGAGRASLAWWVWAVKRQRDRLLELRAEEAAAVDSFRQRFDRPDADQLEAYDAWQGLFAFQPAYLADAHFLVSALYHLDRYAIHYGNWLGWPAEAEAGYDAWRTTFGKNVETARHLFEHFDERIGRIKQNMPDPSQWGSVLTDDEEIYIDFGALRVPLLAASNAAITLAESFEGRYWRRVWGSESDGA